MEQSPDNSTKREVGEVAVKAAAGLVPFAGGPLAELLDYMMTAAYSRRWQQWGTTVGTARGRGDHRTPGADRRLAAHGGLAPKSPRQ
jgi:hypothetical protein